MKLSPPVRKPSFNRNDMPSSSRQRVVDGTKDEKQIATSTRNKTSPSTGTRRKIALSTRFSLKDSVICNGGCYSEAEKFSDLLMDHGYVVDGNFHMYEPITFEK